MAKSLEQQIKSILNDPAKVRKLKTSTGETVEEMLKVETKKFLDILEEEIENAVYKRPMSQWYKRTGDLRDSLDKNLVIDPKTNTITIGFNDKAWHDSYISKTYDSSYSKQAYVPQGIREGFEIFNSGHYVEGIDYVQSAIDRFEKVKRKGIIITVDENLRGNWWR